MPCRPFRADAVALLVAVACAALPPAVSAQTRSALPPGPAAGPAAPSSSFPAAPPLPGTTFPGSPAAPGPAFPGGLPPGPAFPANPALPGGVTRPALPGTVRPAPPAVPGVAVPPSPVVPGLATPPSSAVPTVPGAAGSTSTVPPAARRTPPRDAPALDLPAAAASGTAATATLSAGPRLSLAELTETVLRSNPGLLSAERLRAVASAGIVTAGALPNPRLDFSRGEQNPRTLVGLSGPIQTFGVSQLIENPALRQARLEAARSNERFSAQQVAVARNELVAQVRLRAWDLLLRQAEAGAAAEAAALLEQVNARVRARVESGEAPRYELIKAEAEIINARSLQQTGLLQAQQAGLTLNRLAAGALPAAWTLDVTLAEVIPPPDVAALRVQMLDRNPELLALRAEVERASAQLDGARAGRWPGVELRYGHSRDPDVRQNAIGVSVQVPLLDRRIGPITEAATELERIRGRADGRRAELEQQLLLAVRALEMAQLRVDALSKGAVRDAEAALRVADAAWRFGERGILDVLDAQRVLRAVRADLLTARFQVQAARTELDFLTGRWSEPVALPTLVPSLPPPAAPATPAAPLPSAAPSAPGGRP